MIGRMHTSQLDDYVAECDKRGGIWTDECKQFVADFELEVDSVVDRGLDPFSAEYFAQMINLYREISNKDLDQASNELHPFDFDNHLNGVNPYNSQDVSTMGHHVAASALTLRLAGVPAGGKVLDMGVGMGLSSETLAYCGATVTSVDINPAFVELTRKRAARRNLPISPRLSNFDDYVDEPETYDLALFVGALHHGLRPWEILERVSRLVKPDGKIALVMEPIQKTWWPYWGIRLDSESVYVARKFGWFESGFSKEFLEIIFDRIGFKATINRYDPELFAGGFFCLARKADCRTVTEFPFQPVISRGQTLQFSTDLGSSYLSFGWSECEPWGIWSSGHHAGLLLNLPEGDAWTLTFDVHPMVSATHPTQEITISIDGTEIATRVINAEEGSSTMTVSSSFAVSFNRQQIGSASPGKPTELVFGFPSAARPLDIGRGGDIRNIAIGLISLTLT